MVGSTDSFQNTVIKAATHPGAAIQSLRKCMRERVTPFDLDTFFDAIAEITNAPISEIQSVYDECVNGQPMQLYNDRFSSHVPTTNHFNLRRLLIGNDKFVRLDRIGLYCIIRLIEPSIVIETGVEWGTSALFITKALDENGSGKLYSFDIGVDAAPEKYNVERETKQVGFMVPDKLDHRWELIIGDSIEQMKSTLPSIDPVDIFYHDSLHTYDHMMGEFELVYPHIRNGGLLMSEDINLHSAWEDFLREHETELEQEARYYSMQGIDQTVREVGAARIHTLKS
jgi:predicted O-methyltransferase YrrM